MSTDALKKDEEGQGVSGFLRETRAEWDKTTFPSSEDVTNTTIIVIISTIFVTFFLYVMDLIWVFLLATSEGPFDGVGLLVWVVNKIAGA